MLNENLVSSVGYFRFRDYFLYSQMLGKTVHLFLEVFYDMPHCSQNRQRLLSPKQLPIMSKTHNSIGKIVAGA